MWDENLLSACIYEYNLRTVTHKCDFIHKCQFKFIILMYLESNWMVSNVYRVILKTSLVAITKI